MNMFKLDFSSENKFSTCFVLGKLNKQVKKNNNIKLHGK